nr:hypothetical protein [Candidatus Freyarchaeota archaeon]
MLKIICLACGEEIPNQKGNYYFGRGIWYCPSCEYFSLAIIKKTRKMSRPQEISYTLSPGPAFECFSAPRDEKLIVVGQHCFFGLLRRQGDSGYPRNGSGRAGMLILFSLPPTASAHPAGGAYAGILFFSDSKKCERRM